MANNPIASHKAKPNKVNWNNFGSCNGFLLIPKTKAPKTIPIPAPAPAHPIVAKPAPIDLPATVIALKKKKKKKKIIFFF